MHILVTNDDGPPSNQSSPYVHSLVSTLQQAGHTVSVCLPDTQKSWIGKAHMIGQTLTTSYFRPGTILQDDGVTQDYPFDDGKEEWVLVDGTPASCTQIGLHHVFKDRRPIDLVLSGPNYGRNTTAVFSLSSGTIGAALEGAVNGVKSIALSYAFDSREHVPEIIAAASRISVRLIEKLVAEWPRDVHLYSVNVPLRPNVETTKIRYTNIIQNTWSGSSFTEVPATESDADPNKEEQKIRDGTGAGVNGSASRSKPSRRGRLTFKWSPSFADVRRAVEEAGSGDGWTIVQGEISVTPLKANYWGLPQYSGEIKLDEEVNPKRIPIRTEKAAQMLASSPSPRSTIHAIIDYPDPYVHPLILDGLARVLNINFNVTDSIPPNSSSEPTLQISSYETLDFEHAQSHPSTSLVSAYVIRKALVRKHYLSNTVATWLVKRPDSLLARHVKPAVHFELDFAEFLDEALVDAWDLNESLERNERLEEGQKREWWILKPGMSDGGNGIRLFSSMAELQAIFEEWDEDEVDEDEAKEEDDSDEDDRRNEDEEAGGRAMTSQLRHFIAQPYIDPPLLLSSYGRRKFHIRTYVLAFGALKVYVYKEMLALFAAKTYEAPSTGGSGDEPDLSQHLTNTCFQSPETRAESVHRFWSLKEADISVSDFPTLSSPGSWQENIFKQICQITGEMFEAAARDQTIHFQTVPNAFEIFGVDFLVDAEGNVWLLEVNAYPDFKQTGDELRDIVVGGLFEEVVKVGVVPFFSQQRSEYEDGTERMVLVKSLDLGRR